MIEPYGYHAFVRAEEMLRVADEHRQRRIATSRRPSVVTRVYARIWWASRPRAGSWAPALLR